MSRERINPKMSSELQFLVLTTGWRLFEWTPCSCRWREPALFPRGSRREPGRCWAQTGPSTAACRASCVPARNRGSPREWRWTAHLPRRDSLRGGHIQHFIQRSLVPVWDSLVLLLNMSSVAFMGAVSRASMVSTLPGEPEDEDRRLVFG